MLPLRPSRERNEMCEEEIALLEGMSKFREHLWCLNSEKFSNFQGTMLDEKVNVDVELS